MPLAGLVPPGASYGFKVIYEKGMKGTIGLMRKKFIARTSVLAFLMSLSLAGNASAYVVAKGVTPTVTGPAVSSASTDASTVTAPVTVTAPTTSTSAAAGGTAGPGFGLGTDTGSVTDIAGASGVLLPSNFYCSNVVTYTYMMMVQDLGLMQQQYPSMKLDTIGTTPDGRALYHVIVGNPNAKHKILVHGGMHAREYISSQLVMREIASLLEMQKQGTSYKGCSIAQLLETTCIHFVPMVNPDGISLVQSGLAGIQTQAGLQSVQSILQMNQVSAEGQADFFHKWKNNIRGVNLNRNFDANWALAPQTIAYPSNMKYKGTSAESEPESKALANLTRSVMPDRTISYHTQGHVIYWKFGDGAYLTEGQNFVNLVHQDTGYMIDDAYYPNDAGGYKDWTVLVLGIPSVTIEVGYGTSPVPESQINNIWAENQKILPDTMIDLYLK